MVFQVERFEAFERDLSFFREFADGFAGRDWPVTCGTEPVLRIVKILRDQHLTDNMIKFVCYMVRSLRPVFTSMSYG